MAKNKYNAFTIVELLVAMTLLVMMLGLSGLIFNQTVKAHRNAGASIDVSRSVRSITSQLTSDFRGLRKEAPLLIWFEQQWVDKNRDTVQDIDEFVYYDQIEFFADGDFQTTKQYLERYNSNTIPGLDSADASRLATIYGNSARVYYGHANTPGKVNYKANNILARKAHILTSDAGIIFDQGQIPLITDFSQNPPLIDYNQFQADFARAMASGGTYTQENQYEFNTISLINWINAVNYANSYDASRRPVYLNTANFIRYTIAQNYRPAIKLSDSETLHLLLSQGILQLRIQLAYTPQDMKNAIPGFGSGVRWWPSHDPNGDGIMTDSDFAASFAALGKTQFGTYLKLPDSSTLGYDVDGDRNNEVFPMRLWGTSGVGFNNDYYPKAVKFTFTVRDSNGLFADGKTFSHIVYLD